MTPLKIAVTIDGVPVTQATLSQIDLLRTKHNLHEMKALGAPLDLQDSTIDSLDGVTAKQTLLDLKTQYASLSAMTTLYQKPLATSDAFWHTVATQSTGYDQLQEGRVDLHVTGITMSQLQRVLGSELDSQFAAKINPDHFYSEGNALTGQRIIETFGCFGEPTAMTLYPEKEGFIPTTPDPSYPPSN